MSDRTDAQNALERLAWTLNFHEGESLSINTLATGTGLSWATAQKYTKLLEVLHRIAPAISVDEEGVTVTDVGANLQGLQEHGDLQLLIYLLISAEIEGGPRESVAIDRHADVFESLREPIEALEQLGWIERDPSTITLTPEGVAIAGQARSMVRNTDVDRSPEIQDVKPL